jgi:large subunit ribosomal protein L17
MRHRVGGRKLGLPSDQRRALLKGLVRALFKEGKIVTTETRAKEVKPIAEKLISIAKRAPEGDINARRLVRQYIDSNIAEFGYVSAKNDKGKTVQKPARNPEYVVPKLFEEIAPSYKNRPGGYTRITKIGARRGDAAPMVLLELVEGEEVARPQTEQPAPEEVMPRRRGLFGRKK